MAIDLFLCTKRSTLQAFSTLYTQTFQTNRYIITNFDILIRVDEMLQRFLVKKLKIETATG
jgi:hypothetical protein